jgi:hypothetical protein
MTTTQRLSALPFVQDDRRKRLKAEQANQDRKAEFRSTQAN